MLELVAQSVASRGAGESRTGAHDLLEAFQLRRFYDHVMNSGDRNYLTISTKEVPTGLPGDTSLFAHPSWSLLRPPPVQPPRSEAPERVAERVRRGLRLPPGPAVLSAADKGTDVSRVFVRNIAAPPAAARAPSAAAPAAVGRGAGAAGGGKRRAAASAAAAAPEASGSEYQQGSVDTGYTHESKRQRSNY